MPKFRQAASAGVVVTGGLLLIAPVGASAKSNAVRIKKSSKYRDVTGPVKVQAVPRGHAKKVSFAIDGQRRYVARKAPYRFGGATGRLDPSGLADGKHRITVRAYFKGNKMAKATTTIRVRRHQTTTIAPDTGLPITTTTITTTLPTAAADSSTEAATWDGSADKGFGPWGQIQDGLRDSQFGSSAASIENSPTTPGHKAFKFLVNGGVSSNGPRAELADTYQLKEGMSWWFGDVLYVPSNPDRANGWLDGHHTVLQFKNSGTGSPPLNLDIRDWGGSSAGLYTQEEPWNGSQHYRQIVPMSSLYDRPIPIEIHVKFSSDSSIGEYEVWADGRQVIAPVKMATLLPGLTSGLKEGQYGVSAGNVVYWHGAKRGTTRASVKR